MSLDAGAAFLIYLILMALFLKQSKQASSRRALSRISYWSFLLQSISDAFIFTSVRKRAFYRHPSNIFYRQHASFGIIEENRASLSLLAPGFLACILLINEAVQSSNFAPISPDKDTSNMSFPFVRSSRQMPEVRA